jgi:methyl-accepting chemotaxis protein
LIVASNDQVKEAINRVAVGFALDGKDFVSDTFFSTGYNTEVVAVSAPIRSANTKDTAVAGAVTAVVDIRGVLMDLVGGVKFNASGVAVVVDGDGKILAHPDSSRVDEDVSTLTAVQLAQRTRTTGSIVGKNMQGRQKLFVYRPMANPSSIGKVPWVLLT